MRLFEVRAFHFAALLMCSGYKLAKMDRGGRDMKFRYWFEGLNKETFESLRNDYNSAEGITVTNIRIFCERQREIENYKNDVREFGEWRSFDDVNKPAVT